MACGARLASARGVKSAHVRTGKFAIRRRTFAAMHASATLSLALAAAAALVFPRLALADDLSQERCRLTTDQLPAAFARCGVLKVPENPAAPDGAHLELFVARVAALTSTPKPDPLLLIAGGPGQSTVDFYLQLRGAFEPVRRERDLILVDQRGTGRSSAGFTCNVPDDLALDTAPPEQLQSFIERCVAELEHDPKFYTTTVAVADLERVRAALGIEQWNVYGISYGTRVAQHYLRRFPEHARAVVLDGVVPPALALGPDVAREAQRALDRIFARCEADDGCANALRGPARGVRARCSRGSRQRPSATPRAGGRGRAAVRRAPPTSTFGAQELRALVRFMSYNGATVALLPVLLHEAYAGNYDPLVSQASTLLRGLPESLSFAMSNSVLCTEDVPFVAAGARRRARRHLSRHDDRRFAEPHLLALARGRDRRRLQDAGAVRPPRAAPVGQQRPDHAARLRATGRRDVAEQRAARRAGSGARPVGRRLRAAARREISRRSEARGRSRPTASRPSRRRRSS